MTPPHTFSYTDVNDSGEIISVKIEFFPGTVRSSMEAARLRQKLLIAYGHLTGNPAPDDLYDNMSEYAAAMARTKADAPWWANSNMTEEAVQTAFELFLDKGEDLWQAFRTAAHATAALKKMTTTTPQT